MDYHIITRPLRNNIPGQMDRYDYDPYYDYANYSFVLPFERDFDTRGSTVWMRNNFYVSYTTAIIYLILIFSGRKFMENRKAFELDKPLFFWNAGLAVFSLLGFIRVFPEWRWSLFDQSFTYSACVGSYTMSVSGYWGDKFSMSKIVELFDTAFIVLRKKNLMFLHYYHHVTVLIYCWYSHKEHTGAARWFVVMNYFVHTLMYTYYALSAIKIRAPKMIAMVITVCQISQMFMGCYLGYFVWNRLSNGLDCQQTYESLYMGFAMYFTYFLLFCNFFYNAYVKKSGRRAKTEKAEENKELVDKAVKDSEDKVRTSAYRRPKKMH